MPDNNDYKVIYKNDDLEEFHKAFHYMRLLELNDSFMADVNAIRRRYDISVEESNGETLDAIEQQFEHLLADEHFINDVRIIARRIKLQGDWLNGLSLYVCGQPAGATLYPDFDLHRIEARAITDTDEPYIEMRLYGDITRQELEKATKNIRLFIENNMKYESVNRLGDKTILKMSFIRKSLNEKKSFKEIAEVLVDHNFSPQTYSDVRKQYQEFMHYVERIYQE